jgi:hypothetical protein
MSYDNVKMSGKSIPRRSLGSLNVQTAATLSKHL